MFEKFSEENPQTLFLFEQLHICQQFYEADTKTLSCPCRLFLLFGQDLCTPIGQQWYQVIEKQKKLIRVSHHQEHDQERVLVSASYQHNKLKILFMIRGVILAQILNKLKYL